MITSSPGLHRAVNTLCSECLAPLETTTCPAVYFRPWVASYCLAIAVRSSGIPLAAV